MRNSTVFAILVLTVGAVLAQEEDVVSLRVKSEAVLLDLIVTDPHGNFIDDLRPEEVQVREDGKEQEIGFFQLYRAPAQALHRGRPRSAGGAAAPILAADETSFGSPARNTPLVFVVDLGSLNHGDLSLVKKSIADFVSERAGDGVRFMLASAGMGLQVRQPFTEDAERLKAALKSIQPLGNPRRLQLGSMLNDLELLFRSHASNPNNFLTLIEAARIAVDRGVAYLHGLEGRLQQTTSNLRLLSSSLRSLPGRKHIVFYSAGYLLEPTDSIREMIRLRFESELFGRLEASERSQLSGVLARLQRKDLHGYLRDLINEANRSQVSIYSVDARGLVAPTFDPAQTLRGGVRLAMLGRRARYVSHDMSGPQDFLVSLASATGGIPFLNSNDLSRGALRAYQDAHEYYLLSYQPTSQRMRGKFHRIQVKVNRPGARVRHRTGYLDMPEREVAQREILNALSFPGLFSDRGLRVETASSGDKLTVKTLIPTTALEFSPEGSQYFCPVETYGVLVDNRGKWLADNVAFAKSHRLTVDPRKLPDLRKVDYVSTVSEVTAPAGKYTLVVVVRRGLNAQLASTVEQIEVVP